MANDIPDNVLADRVVAVPETRQLDVLATLLTKRGANVVRCPLVSIVDTPDSGPVVAWLHRMIAAPAHISIFYTGEGIDRLLGFARRNDIGEEFAAALARTRKLCRGPKPKRALRRLGLSSDIDTPLPTTEGILQALEPCSLSGRRVAVQLYGDRAAPALTAYLAERGATADCVAPYVYASSADDGQVADLIGRLAERRIDAIAFTSKTQVERLLEVAHACGRSDELISGLKHVCVAAVGPVVADRLAASGIEVDVMPAGGFFMKPLVSALAKHIGAGGDSHVRAGR